MGELLYILQLNFFGEYCSNCFRGFLDETINYIISNISSGLLEELPLPPFELYHFGDKIVVELPGKKFVFKNKRHLVETVRHKGYKLLRTKVECDVGEYTPMRWVSSLVNDGDWQLLELAVLIKAIENKKLIHRIKNFEDIIGLVAYVEQVYVRELKDCLVQHGMIFSRDQTLGFAPNVIEKFDCNKEILVKKTNNGFRFKNISWEVDPIYMKYLKPTAFKISKNNTLEVKTKYCVIYVAPKIIFHY